MWLLYAGAVFPWVGSGISVMSVRRWVAMVCVLGCSSLARAQGARPDLMSDFVVYPAGTAVALKHVGVIDGTGAPAKAGQTVLIAGGKIVAVGAQVALPAGVKRVDLLGYTVMPGLVGMHDHMYYPAPEVNPAERQALYPEHASSFPLLYLAGGVTSIRTAGSVQTYTDLAVKKLIDEGRMPGPKMHITGPYLEGKGSYTPDMHELVDADDARRTVVYWADEGATSFKAYMHISRDELRAAIEAAHGRGLKVTGHLCSIGFTEAADLGIDNLEHGFLIDTEFAAGKRADVCPASSAVAASLKGMTAESPQMRALFRHLIEKHVAVTSTLPVFETFVPGRGTTDARVLETMLPEARASYLAARTRVAAEKDAAYAFLFPMEEQMEVAFVRAGGTLLAGLDPTGFGGVVPGYGDQREVELLVESGFSPVEAVKIATLNGAMFLGEGGLTGSVEVGKAADLMVVKGDAAKDIRAIEDVEIVFKDGAGYSPTKLRAAAVGTVGLR